MSLSKSNVTDPVNLVQSLVSVAPCLLLLAAFATSKDGSPCLSCHFHFWLYLGSRLLLSSTSLRNLLVVSNLVGFFLGLTETSDQAMMFGSYSRLEAVQSRMLFSRGIPCRPACLMIPPLEVVLIGALFSISSILFWLVSLLCSSVEENKDVRVPGTRCMLCG